MVAVLAFALYGATWYLFMTPQIVSCMGAFSQCYSSLEGNPELTGDTLINLTILGLASVALSVGALIFERGSRNSKTI